MNTSLQPRERSTASSLIVVLVGLGLEVLINVGTDALLRLIDKIKRKRGAYTGLR